MSGGFGTGAYGETPYGGGGSPADSGNARMIPWPLTTEVNGEPDVVRDEDDEVVWTEIPAPADLAADRTLVPLEADGDGPTDYIFGDDGEILAAEVSRDQEILVDDTTGQPLVADDSGEPLTAD